jgi:serine/threonine-protein kinase
LVAGAVIKLEAGHVLDERYALESVIGEGGMGTVFAAKHLQLGDQVAVKVLQSSSAQTLTEEHIERFLREARLAVKIKNDHVVRVLDVARGKHDSPPYIVMELLEGVDLGDLVRTSGKVPIPNAVDYVLQAAAALAEAHALGIVHRDLKSSNLHLSRRSDGSPLVKVLDFGISKAHDEAGDINLTQTSAVFGSPAYMSPEQIRSSKHVDQRTDIWALGVVLYELLTNDLPFVADNAGAMLAAIAADVPIPLRHFVPNAPEGLERAIIDAFVKDRERRTGSMAAFAASIAPYGGPTASTLLAEVQRAAHRSATGSRAPNSMPPPPASIPVGGAPISTSGPTMRIVEPPVSSGHMSADPMVRTDRDFEPPVHRGSSPIPALIAVGALVLCVGIGTSLLVWKKMASKPPPSLPAVVTTAEIPAPQAAIELPPSEPTAPEPAAVPSAKTARPRASQAQAHSARTAPVPSPPPTPSKPNGTLDTNSRE